MGLAVLFFAARKSIDRVVILASWTGHISNLTMKLAKWYIERLTTGVMDKSECFLVIRIHKCQLFGELKVFVEVDFLPLINRFSIDNQPWYSIMWTCNYVCILARFDGYVKLRCRYNSLRLANYLIIGVD